MKSPGALAVAVLVALLLPGIVGHDPWKPDEAYTFGLVFDILQSHQWVVPMLASGTELAFMA